MDILKTQANVLSRDSLIKARSVGVFVLLYDGDDESDEFGPEVQVFDAGTLLIWRDRLRLQTEREFYINIEIAASIKDFFAQKRAEILQTYRYFCFTHRDLQGLSDIPCCRGRGSC